MKVSDIKPNTLILFNYKKSHPKEDRLFYVSKVDSTTITGKEFSDIGVPTKKFLTAHIVNLSLVPSAKLPIEAEDYAYEIFANILKEDENSIRMEEVFGELVGYACPKPKRIGGRVDSYANSLSLNINNKAIRLFITDNEVKLAEYPYTILNTPQELAQYILTSLS